MEKVNILYSIIIPHYNVPELLQRCLNSIPNLPSFQIIIVDDCSDGKIVDFRCFPGMERENVKCIFLKEKHGAGFARNLGLLAVNGCYLQMQMIFFIKIFII